MKYKVQKKKVSASNGNRKSNKHSISRDPFFEGESKKRRKIGYEDEDIESGDSEEENEILGDSDGGGSSGDEEQEEYAMETADEKRKRLAEEHVEKVRKYWERKRQTEGEDEERGGEGSENENEGVKDSLVASILQKEQLEESGRVRRVIASR